MRIGVVTSISVSGPVGAASSSALDGIRMAVDRVNDLGGVTVDGQVRPVSLVTHDDQDRPAEAATGLVHLVSQDGVVAVIGPSFSRNAVPAAEAAERVGVPMVSPGAANLRVTEGHRYVFRIVSPDYMLGAVMARFLHGELGAERVAILFNAADLYSNGIEAVVRTEMAARGGQVVASRKYTPDQGAGSPLDMEAIGASEAQALFLPNTDPTVVLSQVRAVRATGFQGHLVLGGTWSAEAFSDPELEGAFLVSQWHPLLPSDSTRAFVEAFRDRFHRIPPNAAAQGYDAAMVLMRAMAASGSTDPDRIREALATPRRYEGASGLLEFDGSGDPLRPVVVLQVQDGAPRFLLTIEPPRAYPAADQPG